MKNKFGGEGEAGGAGGDAVWHERQKAGRKRASWPWTLGLCAVAACYAGYVRLEWQSRQHPLQLRVLHIAQPGDAKTAPLLQIELPDAPASSEGHAIEGPQWEMRVKKTAFRPADTTEWKPGSPQQTEYATKYLLGTPTSRRDAGGKGQGNQQALRATWTRERALGLPAGDHTMEVEVEGYLLDEAENVWSASTTASLHIAIPTPTMPPPTRAIDGVARLQYAMGLVKSKPSPKASGEAVDAALWRDLPAPGQKGFPLIVPGSGFVSFRVVQKGRAPGDPASFAPLKPRWKEASGGADFWEAGLDFAYLPVSGSAPPGGAYKRIEAIVEAQDTEVVRGVAPAKVREGDKPGAVGWILVRPQDSEGQPIPPFDEQSAGQIP